MADVFISYAREDTERVGQIVVELEKRGLSVFWDRGIPPGRHWKDYIAKALDESRCVLVVWSRHSINSAWVREEAEVAKKRGILVPHLLDEVQVPPGFGGVQAADLSEWKNNSSEPVFQLLIGAIEAKISLSSKQVAQNV